MQYKILRADRLCLLLFLLINSFFIQCKQETPGQIKINQLHESVMEIHDEVMPKMSEIYSLKKKLTKVESDERVVQLIEDLEAADEMMMSWMHQYKKPSNTDDTSFAYLDSQSQAIKEVKDKMLTAISNAQKFLENE